MDAATAIVIAQYAIKYGIPAAKALVNLFNKNEATQADWDSVWALSETPFDQGLNPSVLIP